MIGTKGLGLLLGGAHRAAEFQPVHRLHRQVAEHQVAFLFAQHVQRGAAIVGFDDFADADGIEQRAQQRAHMLIVLDNQNLQMLQRRPRHTPSKHCAGCRPTEIRPRENDAQDRKLLPEVTAGMVIIRLQMAMGNIPDGSTLANALFFAAAPLYGAPMSEARAPPKLAGPVRKRRPTPPGVEALNQAAFGPGRFAKSAYRLREGVAPAAGLVLCRGGRRRAARLGALLADPGRRP